MLSVRSQNSADAVRPPLVPILRSVICSPDAHTQVVIPRLMALQLCIRVGPSPAARAKGLSSLPNLAFQNSVFLATVNCGRPLLFYSCNRRGLWNGSAKPVSGEGTFQEPLPFLAASYGFQEVP